MDIVLLPVCQLNSMWMCYVSFFSLVGGELQLSSLCCVHSAWLVAQWLTLRKCLLRDRYTQEMYVGCVHFFRLFNFSIQIIRNVCLCARVSSIEINLIIFSPMCLWLLIPVLCRFFFHFVHSRRKTRIIPAYLIHTEIFSCVNYFHHSMVYFNEFGLVEELNRLN